MAEKPSKPEIQKLELPALGKIQGRWKLLDYTNDDKSEAGNDVWSWPPKYLIIASVSEKIRHLAIGNNTVIPAWEKIIDGLTFNFFFPHISVSDVRLRKK